MFKKILIANRGEIACRLLRTFRRMGIESIAIYSDVDARSLHAAMADEAYCVGPASALESYLNIPSILKIAKENGADAIHPGYGFLSENAAFAQAVQDQGLTFIGPSAAVIAAMGDKLEAKRLARQAGVPCVPGTDTPLHELKSAKEVALEIGYPLMVKAAAGGGGKGMRIVRHSSDLEEGLKGAMNEARSSFGDARIFLEKYIDGARHIEVQILGDHHGRVIHLGERECSLQRRHQKVIEEAPSPSLSPDLRQQICEEAVRLGQTAGYTSAGTVEFVLDPNGDFYFLEMNTRLQVEHPVTEMITGIDIVEEMVLIAAGNPLRHRQSDIRLEGHAIEARLYAEDSSRGFLPSIGWMGTYLPPEEKEGEVRLDGGVEEGDRITPYYDPLFAKLIVHQSNRELACTKMVEALNEYYVRGIETNVHFLTSLVHSSFFKKGDFSVTTLDERYGKGFTPGIPEDPLIAVGTAVVLHMIRQGLTSEEVSVFIEREVHLVSVVKDKSCYRVRTSDSTLIIETKWKPGEVLFKGLFNGQTLVLQVDAKGIKDELFWNGYGVTPWVVNRQVGKLVPLMPVKEKSDTPRIVLAPMPGLIVDLVVQVGDRVKSGQPIAVIEAMKMENIIRAPRDGVIANIYVNKGESVSLDQQLAEIGGGE